MGVRCNSAQACQAGQITLRCCIAVVGVVADGDEDSERRLRQLGLLHVASDADRPDALVDRARAALDAESDLDDPDPTEESPSVGDGPIEPDGDGRRVLAAVWGPKGGPGRTTVAVNLWHSRQPPRTVSPGGRCRHLWRCGRPHQHARTP